MSENHQEGVRSARMRFPGGHHQQGVLATGGESTSDPPPAVPIEGTTCATSGIVAKLLWVLTMHFLAATRETQLGFLGVSHLHLPSMDPLDFGLIMAAKLQ